MKAVACTVVLFCCGLPSTLFAVGFAHDATFIVYAPDQALADQVIAKAQEFRKAEAQDQLGEEQEAVAGRTIITVEVSEVLLPKFGCSAAWNLGSSAWPNPLKRISDR